MNLQSHRSLNFENFKIPNLGGPRQNDICVQAPWLGIENIIRGKVVASLSPGHDEYCEFVFANGISMHQKCFNYALTNLLFGLCKSMWIIDWLVTCPSPHHGAPTRPSTFEVLQTREHTPTPYPPIIFTLDSHLSLLRNFGVHQSCFLLSFLVCVGDLWFVVLFPSWSCSPLSSQVCACGRSYKRKGGLWSVSYQ
jgi:hypothetical protein